MKTQCPRCSKQFNVTPELAGKRAKCGECKSVFQITLPMARPISQGKRNRQRFIHILQRYSFGWTVLGSILATIVLGLLIGLYIRPDRGKIISETKENEVATTSEPKLSLPHQLKYSEVAIDSPEERAAKTEVVKIDLEKALVDTAKEATSPVEKAQPATVVLRSGMDAVVDLDIFAAVDYEAHERMAKYLMAGDRDGMIILAAKGLLISLDKGQTVRVIRAHVFTVEARVTSGIGKGIEVVIPHEFLVPVQR